jgi:type I site-specific restriction endonuclease
MVDSISEWPNHCCTVRRSTPAQRHLVAKVARNLCSQKLSLKMLIEAGAGTRDELKKVRSGSGLGLFVRSMVGLDREAAKRAFDWFLAGKTLAANQIQFVNLMIDYLTQSGYMSEIVSGEKKIEYHEIKPYRTEPLKWKVRSNGLRSNTSVSQHHLQALS